ncbi:hypothetical protein Vadar_006537 [Vaccinium darrowii]|uniref:Uncharacterized protein n=1 Tax=Vaccinium darrowii TaxID=229202 RepID=A0ACB7YVJ5_9ERIC|nr:hypothetical protein Vadar_006537 [Vaccinium darrowii]
MATPLLGPPEIRHPTTTSNPPPMDFTENNSATYLATGNPCLDFFFHVVPNTPPEQLSDKEGFYTTALWLHKHHPKTLACNVKAIAEFGYFKDMLEILYRILEGPEIRKKEKNGVAESEDGSEPGSKEEEGNGA